VTLIVAVAGQRGIIGSAQLTVAEAAADAGAPPLDGGPSAPLTITDMTPTQGPRERSTPITITGTGFVTGQTTVHLAALGRPEVTRRELTNVNVVSPTMLTAVVPPQDPVWDYRRYGAQVYVTVNGNSVTDFAKAAFTYMNSACTPLTDPVTNGWHPGEGTAGFALGFMFPDGDFLYWFDYENTGSVKKLPKAGGAVTVLASGVGAVNNIALDADYLYLSAFDSGLGDGRILKVSKVATDGGAPVVLASGHPPLADGGTTAEDIFFPGAISVDGDFVYFNHLAAGIWRVSKTGGPVTIIGAGIAGSCDQLDADYFYGNVRVPEDGGTRVVRGRTTRDGSRADFLAGLGQNVVGKLLLDSGYLYWYELGIENGTIRRVAISGATGLEVLDSVRNAHGIAVDETYVYYGSQGPPGEPNVNHPAVYKAPKQGGVAAAPARYAAMCGNAETPTAVVQLQEIAVDATAIYVLEAFTARIYKLAK
jgi:hypothetical protein